MKSPAKCGTDAGYYKHYRQKEDACGPCKKAHRLADAERRLKDPFRDSKYKAERRARDAARIRLAEAHPAEYVRYYYEALEREERGQNRN